MMEITIRMRETEVKGRVALEIDSRVCSSKDNAATAVEVLASEILRLRLCKFNLFLGIDKPQDYDDLMEQLSASIALNSDCNINRVVKEILKNVTERKMAKLMLDLLPKEDDEGIEDTEEAD